MPIIKMSSVSSRPVFILFSWWRRYFGWTSFKNVVHARREFRMKDLVRILLLRKEYVVHISMYILTSSTFSGDCLIEKQLVLNCFFVIFHKFRFKKSIPIVGVYIPIPKETKILLTNLSRFISENFENCKRNCSGSPRRVFHLYRRCYIDSSYSSCNQLLQKLIHTSGQWPQNDTC